jgi:hypothetical protein
VVIDLSICELVIYLLIWRSRDAVLPGASSCPGVREAELAGPRQP